MELTRPYTKLKSRYIRNAKLQAKRTDEKIERLEDYPREIREKIEQALKDVDEGNYRPFEEFCAEMEAKYGIR